MSVKQHRSSQSSPQRFRNGTQDGRPSRSTSTRSATSMPKKQEQQSGISFSPRTAGLRSQRSAGEPLCDLESLLHLRDKHGQRFKPARYLMEGSLSQSSLIPLSTNLFERSDGGTSAHRAIPKRCALSSCESTRTLRSVMTSMSYPLPEGSL